MKKNESASDFNGLRGLFVDWGILGIFTGAVFVLFRFFNQPF